MHATKVTFLLGTAILTTSQAAVFHIPLHTRSVPLTKRGLASQQPLGSDPSTGSSNSDGSSRLPLTAPFAHDLEYFTQITIGTPPQTFQVLVDISSPETFVTSKDCSTCLPGGDRYDASASSSSLPNGTSMSMDYGWMLASGSLIRDTMTIGHLQIDSQLFTSATEVEHVGLSWDDRSIIHGILGLTPSTAGSSQHNPSPFLSMAPSLDKPLFSMRLLEPRELSFGGVNNTLFTGPITRVPLTYKSSPYSLTGRWQTPVSYLSVGSDPGYRLDLSNLTASFTTSSAFMLLPDLVVYQLLIKDLEFEEIMFMPPSVPCSRLQELPDLFLNLGGDNFTLTPWDYTIQWPMRGEDFRCVSAILPMGLPPTESQEIVLGSAFLRAFYSVFDLETETIGFAKLSQL